jgi:diguanylate cyclase
MALVPREAPPWQASRAARFAVAPDDLGTGYSSLAHLCDLPIDRLKIDRSFVSRATEVQDAAAICKAVIDVAGSLGVAVIAEGVETREQANLLQLLAGAAVAS